MANTWWQILGVAPDADRLTVKRAYSRLIKMYRPDAEPEAFARIRAAYEVACAQIAQSSEGGITRLSISWTDSAQDDSIAGNTFVPELVIAPELDSGLYPPEQKPGDLADALTELVNLLGEWKRSGYRNKTPLARFEAHPALLELDNIAALRYPILCWLDDHTKSRRGLLGPSLSLPYADLARLDKLFGWRRLERVYSDVPDRDFSLVMFGIHRGNGNTLYQHPQISHMIRSRPSIRQVSRLGIPIMCIVGLVLLASISTNQLRNLWSVVPLLVGSFVFTFGGYLADYWRINHLSRYPRIRPWLAALDWAYFSLRHVLIPGVVLLVVGGLTLAGSGFVIQTLWGGFQRGFSTDESFSILLTIMMIVFMLWFSRNFFINELDESQVAWWRVRRYTYRPR